MVGGKEFNFLASVAIANSRMLRLHNTRSWLPLPRRGRHLVNALWSAVVSLNVYLCRIRLPIWAGAELGGVESAGRQLLLLLEWCRMLEGSGIFLWSVGWDDAMIRGEIKRLWRQTRRVQHFRSIDIAIDTWPVPSRSFTQFIRLRLCVFDSLCLFLHSILF